MELVNNYFNLISRAGAKLVRAACSNENAVRSKLLETRISNNFQLMIFGELCNRALNSRGFRSLVHERGGAAKPCRLLGNP